MRVIERRLDTIVCVYISSSPKIVSEMLGMYIANGH